MSDDKKNVPIKDETLDKVSGGVQIDPPQKGLIPKGYGPPPIVPRPRGINPHPIKPL